MDINDDETIDSEVCGFLLHCEAKTIEELARQGVLPGFKLGKSWTFFRDQVIAAARELAEENARKRRSASQNLSPSGYIVQSPKSKREGPPVLPTIPGDVT